MMNSPSQRLQKYINFGKSRREQANHDKEPDLNVAESGQAPSLVDTTSTSSTIATEEFVNTTRRPYPIKPSTIRTATTYSVFSDPSAFEIETIRSQTHYLSRSLKGKIWWDINGDGKRGDWTNETLNTDEYDYGIPNVNQIHLVTCDDAAQDTGSTKSMPYNNRYPVPLKQSRDSNAGIYEFNDLDNIPSGRYYVMYQSPPGWRMSGGSLPLDRKKVEDEVMEYYECVPKGGNGQEYSKDARELGDFDMEGYCARSIGCVEIGSRSELVEIFKDLRLLEDTDYYIEVIQGDAEPHTYELSTEMNYTDKKWVAMPSPQVMDVGMSKAEWPLKVEQFADAVVTLEFPVSGRRRIVESDLETLLFKEFANAQSFATGGNRVAVKNAIDTYIRDNIGKFGSGGELKSASQQFFDETVNTESEIFAFAGVDLFHAIVERKEKKKDTIGRQFRDARWTQEVQEVLEITYTFTAKGSYNPPPHEQLGYFIQNSINGNPEKLVRTLREDPELPFEDLVEVGSTHLTLGPSVLKPCEGCLGFQAIENQDTNSGIDRWTSVPVALLTVTTVSLILLFLGRRVWKRRKEVIDTNAQET